MQKMRHAVAMIELIFAIVIMAIVLMAAPNLMSMAKTSTYTAMQQEAIALLAAKVGSILTYPWDEGDVTDTNYAPILVANGDTDLNEIIISLPGGGTFSTARRAGTPISSKRTFIENAGALRINATAVSNLGPDAGDKDDIDDFIGDSGIIYEESTTIDSGDIVDISINMNTDINYSSDSADYNADPTMSFADPFGGTAGTTTNIKTISVTLTTTIADLNKTITLKAFSCNIGSYQLNERTLP
jgi:hypothetical protein